MVTAHALGRRLAFPAVLGGALAAALVLMPTLGTARAVVLVQGASAAAIIVLERLLPFRHDWNRSHGDLRTDALHAAASGLGTAEILLPVAKIAGGLLAARLAGAIGAVAWPVGWPLLAQLALALLVAELAQYWWHRLQHEREILWRVHAVHHSAPRLYWLNAARFHPLDLGVLYAVGYLPLIVLGCPEEVILLFALFDAVFGMLQHCNIDVALGALNGVFSMAEPHRWHHSRLLAEANSNYGSNLIVWDRVFGTFFLPGDRAAPAAIGIGDMPAFPPGYLAQLASPFRWRRLREEAAVRR
jgi:sterol desaturase/sphingolipid hydroxylase (fatty acid hydroxylase superfamily)